MNAADLLQHARRLIAPPNAAPTEADLPCAVSAAYYALFHALTTAGAQSVAPGNRPLQNQVTRAFNHTAMRKVCDAYVQTPARPYQQPALANLNPAAPNLRLSGIAEGFAELQEARHAADYNLMQRVKIFEAALLIGLANAALLDLAAIQFLPETQVFLTALLLADRWTRRG